MNRPNLVVYDLEYKRRHCDRYRKMLVCYCDKIIDRQTLQYYLDWRQRSVNISKRFVWESRESVELTNYWLYTNIMSPWHYNGENQSVFSYHHGWFCRPELLKTIYLHTDTLYVESKLLENDKLWFLYKKSIFFVLLRSRSHTKMAIYGAII